MEYELKKKNVKKLLMALAIIFIVLYTNKTGTVMAATALPSRLFVDAPSANQLISGTSFGIKGWALNPSGIRSIKIYIDNVYIANAIYGGIRSDVNVAYPGYTNGSKSGFTYNVGTNNIKAGAHIITIYSYGNNGTTQSQNINITISKKPPLAFIDLPTNNQTIVFGNGLYVKGWSLNPSSVAAVAIYVDNKFIQNATIGKIRNDVNSGQPGYPNGDKSGFEANINGQLILPGTHKLSVVSIGKDGSKVQVDKYINVNKKESLMFLDNPTINFTTTQDNINVDGWALNDAGIREVRYYFNGTFVATSYNEITRNDVNAAMPGYLNGNKSGFSVSFKPLWFVPKGISNANLKVIAIGKDGTSTTLNRNIILNKLPERICIDTPTSSATIKNNINIAGWALDPSGISAINVYLDNDFKGKGTYGGARGDVNLVYPGYTNGHKSGLSYQLDITKITPGDHTLRVESVGNNRVKVSQNIDIKVYGTVEYHSYNLSVDNMVNIQLNSRAVFQNTATWTWDPANASMIKGYVDPANITNDEYRKYEYLKLSYNDGASVTDLNHVLNGKGILSGNGQLFINSSKNNNINPIYLISHAILETGNGTSALSTGILVSSVDGVAVTPRVVYNLFGIGAYDSNANKYGSEYAYKQGWFSVAQAIDGGAYFISNGYINNASYNQNTLYKMRWNPAKPGTHQYATDIRWAYNQISNIKKLIDNCPNSLIYFDIPVYK